VAVAYEDEDEERLQKRWAEFGVGVPLEVVRSPYRRLVDPVLQYLDNLDRRWENDLVTVLIPEYVVRRWWDHLLHNQDALQLKARLWVRRGTAVTSVPSHLD
jgi:predicted ABC-type ATPase